MPPEKPRKNGDINSAHLLPPDDVLFGRSAAMQELRQRAEKVCGTNISVFLTGDAGTGKEVLARWLHNHSPASHGEFVKVNCAAIPGALLESELFGYEKGAFTGAHISKPGRVELALNGTLFLDDIADLELSLQSKLLQFLQDGRFSRIGGETERVIETRLICASKKDLEQEIAAGRFRADLYYRINVVCLRLPRLHERREDIAALAEYFRKQHEKEFRKESAPLGAVMVHYLRNLDWPGNLRELSNGIARYVLIGPETAIISEPYKRRTAAAQASTDGTSAVPLKGIAKEAIRNMEREVILETLRANQWNRRKTAQSLNISYRTLIYKLRNAGLTHRRSELNLTSQVDSNRASPSPAD